MSPGCEIKKEYFSPSPQPPHPQIEGDCEAVASMMADSLIARIDTDGDGTLNEEEFLRVIRIKQITTNSHSFKLQSVQIGGMTFTENNLDSLAVS